MPRASPASCGRQGHRKSHLPGRGHLRSPSFLRRCTSGPLQMWQPRPHRCLQPVLPFRPSSKSRFSVPPLLWVLVHYSELAGCGCRSAHSRVLVPTRGQARPRPAASARSLRGDQGSDHTARAGLKRPPVGCPLSKLGGREESWGASLCLFAQVRPYSLQAVLFVLDQSF